MMDDKNLFGEYAGFLSRAAAYITDLVIIAIILSIANWFVTAGMNYFTRIDIRACPPLQPLTISTLTCGFVYWSMLLFTILFTPIYYFFFWILSGQTPGKYLFGLCIVRMNGQGMNFLTCLIRFLGYQLDILFLGLGFLNILINDQRQGWHDKLARTCVVYSWEARQNASFLQRVQKRLQPRRKQDAVG